MVNPSLLSNYNGKPVESKATILGNIATDGCGNKYTKSGRPVCDHYNYSAIQ